jgi:hypothetical protein
MDIEELKRKLGRVKPGPVEVKLAAKKVVAGIPKSGLWPRVTVVLDGVEEKVSLTYYADVKQKERKGLDPIAVAILRLCGVPGRSMRAVWRDGRVKAHLQYALHQVQTRISSSISRAQTTKRMAPRIDRYHRKHRQSKAEVAVKAAFRKLIFGGEVKLNDLKPRQVGEWWGEVLNEKVVQEVHDY